MIAKQVRIGNVEDQDQFRREDVRRMRPEARLLCLVNLRDLQFGAASIPIRQSGAVSYRKLPFLRHLASAVK